MPGVYMGPSRFAQHRIPRTKTRYGLRLERLKVKLLFFHLLSNLL